MCRPHELALPPSSALAANRDVLSGKGHGMHTILPCLQGSVSPRTQRGTNQPQEIGSVAPCSEFSCRYSSLFPNRGHGRWREPGYQGFGVRGVTRSLLRERPMMVSSTFAPLLIWTIARRTQEKIGARTGTHSVALTIRSTNDQSSLSLVRVTLRGFSLSRDCPPQSFTRSRPIV